MTSAPSAPTDRARGVRGGPLALLALFLLGACSDLPFLGGGDSEPPLPGRRISILAVDRGVTADSALQDVEVLLPPPYVNEAWSHSAGSPAHAMYHLSLSENPRVLWSDDVGEGSGSDQILLAQPVVVGDFVFAMDARSLVTAYDGRNGERIWRVDLEPEEEDEGYFGGGIGYGDRRLFVTTGFGKAFALDAVTGEMLWEAEVPGPVRAAPTVADGQVYIVLIDNQLLTLDAETGERLWSHVGLQETAGLIGAASPAVEGETVVVPYSSGEIFALSAEDGQVIWAESLASLQRVDPLADLPHIRGEPVIDRGIVFAISHSGRMLALDLEQGLRAWDIDVGGVETPWIAGDFLYVLTNEQLVLCLQRKDGRIKWVQALPQFEDPEDQEDPIRWTGPVLASDRLIVAGSHGEALSLSPYTGRILGYFELPAGAAVPPVVANNALFFLTEDGRLVAMK